jgi:hypothetical protein
VQQRPEEQIDSDRSQKNKAKDGFYLLEFIVLNFHVSFVKKHCGKNDSVLQ